MSPEEIAALRDKLAGTQAAIDARNAARSAAQAKPFAAKPAKPADPMAPFQADLDAVPHGMVDPIAQAKAVRHLTADIMAPDVFSAHLATYRGRMAIAALVHSGQVTCEGCLQGIRDILTEAAPGADRN